VCVNQRQAAAKAVMRRLWLEGESETEGEWEGTAAKQAGVRLPLRSLIISFFYLCARASPFRPCPDGGVNIASNSSAGQPQHREDAGNAWKWEGEREYSTQRSARYWSCWPPFGQRVLVGCINPGTVILLRTMDLTRTPPRRHPSDPCSSSLE
jgi:hypothetical protein